MTLTEFLLARVAEDEAAVNERTGRMAPPGSELLEHFGDYGDDERWMIEIPAGRLLAECEAKRRIVEVVQAWRHLTVEDCWYSCAATYGTDVENACCNDGAGTECDCGLDYRVALILRPLASVYADHPDYRDEWNA